MAASWYTEGRLRRFILIHHDRLPFSRCRGLETSKWGALGIGIHVSKVGKMSAGSIDVLLMSRRGEFGVVEIKKQDSSGRGLKPIEQALRYVAGLGAYKSVESLRSELRKKWASKGTYKWLRLADTGNKPSSRFEKAMGEVFGAKWEELLDMAFRKLRHEPPPIFIVQNEKVHDRTATEIRRVRRGGSRLWGIQVPFPHHHERSWRVI